MQCPKCRRSYTEEDRPRHPRVFKGSSEGTDYYDEYDGRMCPMCWDAYWKRWSVGTMRATDDKLRYDKISGRR